MSGQATVNQISYFEYKAINELVHAHIAEYGRALRAVIAFGRTSAPSTPFDIELLEVLDGWQELAHFQSGSSASLPMRGKLYLHFLSASEFETFAFQHDSDSNPVQDLMMQVMENYQIIYEVPAGYARNILNNVQDAQLAYAQGIYLADPLKPPMLNKG